MLEGSSVWSNAARAGAGTSASSDHYVCCATWGKISGLPRLGSTQATEADQGFNCGNVVYWRRAFNSNNMKPQMGMRHIKNFIPNLGQVKKFWEPGVTVVVRGLGR
jgi:hypothetical protein